MELDVKIEGLSSSVISIDVDVSAIRAEVDVISRKINK